MCSQNLLSVVLGCRKVILISLVLLTCATVSALAQNSSSLSQKGNELFKRQDFDGALKLYNEAQVLDPESAYVHFNIGTAQLKKGDFDKAISSFEKSMLSSDKKLEVKANYNTAYAKYKLGKLKENTDLSKTVELFRQSLDYYKRAIELDPKDKKAKVNHELVEKELKILLDKLKQQQDKQDKKEKQQKEEETAQQDKQEKQGQEQANKGETQDSQAQKQESGQQQQSEQQAARNQEGKQQQSQPQEEKKEESKDAQAKDAQKESKELKESEKAEGIEASSGETKEMSKEEANVLLENFRQEDNMFGNISDTRQGRMPEVLKDW